MRIPIFLALASLGLSACATLHSTGKDGKRQAVLIESTPPGATIFVAGEDVGQTPRFVKLERSLHPSVELASAEPSIEAAATGEKRVTVKLGRRYRWRDSFFSNFVFLTWAPVGWLVDLSTQTAWSTKDSGPIPVKLTPEDRKAVSSGRRVAAIAPPQAPTLALSDAGASALENALHGQRLGANTDLVSFRESLPEFLRGGYDYDDAPREEERNDLYYSLDVNTIFESTITESGDGLKLHAVETDVYSGEKIGQPIDLLFAPSSDLERAFIMKHWWSRLLPNTVGLDFVEEKLSVEQDGTSYYLAPAGNEEWWATGLRYLSAINITNLPERRSGRAAKWSLGLVPVIHLSRKQVQASGLVDTGIGTQQTYVRWQVAGGYCGEVGFQVSRHYFYLDLVPIAEWNEITWREGTRERSVTQGGVQFSSEFGYIYFFNSNWTARLFTRSIPEPTDAWIEALGGRLPPGKTYPSVWSRTGGISIGYRFEPRFERRAWSAVSSTPKK